MKEEDRLRCSDPSRMKRLRSLRERLSGGIPGML
jgi:hypothetical protein